MGGKETSSSRSLLSFVGSRRFLCDLIGSFSWRGCSLRPSDEVTRPTPAEVKQLSWEMVMAGVGDPVGDNGEDQDQDADREARNFMHQRGYGGMSTTRFGASYGTYSRECTTVIVDTLRTGELFFSCRSRRAPSSSKGQRPRCRRQSQRGAVLQQGGGEWNSCRIELGPDGARSTCSTCSLHLTFASKCFGGRHW